MMNIRIATEFSRYPAGRYIKDGPYSGELFRKKFLEPNLPMHEKITIDLDGTRGYGSSFLEEAFGGLVRKGFSKSELKEKLEIKASNQSLKAEIFDFIDKAESPK
jgi:hypothetical protein